MTWWQLRKTSGVRRKEAEQKGSFCGLPGFIGNTNYFFRNIGFYNGKTIGGRITLPTTIFIWYIIDLIVTPASDVQPVRDTLQPLATTHSSNGGISLHKQDSNQCFPIPTQTAPYITQITHDVPGRWGLTHNQPFDRFHAECVCAVFSSRYCFISASQQFTSRELSLKM